ncbi:metal-dependent hydrolase family protein [Rubrivivax albus]|uniref:Amidohydrolase family protein n=1 Tax=Rubrivivax albus TaxID=2499835 RepID=A0A3S2VZR5_9BURK|nr:amidohydrolase family protein [Rubrivivax albus]RVT54154.1 amidohydrolase family protein [Rubrivivax albus]
MGRPAVRQVIRHARVFDSAAAVFRDDCSVVIEDDRIVHVTAEPLQVDDVARSIDAGGRAVLPGLIDAHVHVVATSHDLAASALAPASLVAAESGQLMSAMLRRGFTTVRDAAGADRGLREAVARGLFEGPRLFIAGQPISQTGGHADMRPQGVRQPMFCACAGLGIAGAIADGVGEVRRAVREQVRQGVDQIKIMAGGGVSSPNDPIDGTQFSMEELRAAVEEAEAANRYALAHAYSPRAVTRAVQAGVRSIEHGNLIDEATARVMKTHGTYFVPTLATYAALADEGERLGWSPAMLEKLKYVADRGLEAVRIAYAEGVPVVFGTDLLGHMHARQNSEFTLRAPAVAPLALLQSATFTAARLMGQERHIGVLAPGALADLLIVDGDPATGLDMLATPETGIRLLMQGGRVITDRLAA